MLFQQSCSRERSAIIFSSARVQGRRTTTLASHECGGPGTFPRYEEEGTLTQPGCVHPAAAKVPSKTIERAHHKISNKLGLLGLLLCRDSNFGCKKRQHSGGCCQVQYRRNKSYKKKNWKPCPYPRCGCRAISWASNFIETGPVRKH